MAQRATWEHPGSLNFEKSHLTWVLPIKARRRLEAALKNPYKSEKNPYIFLCFLMFLRRFLIDPYRFLRLQNRPPSRTKKLRPSTFFPLDFSQFPLYLYNLFLKDIKYHKIP
jgi:hypothetical protein